ncbi:MAG: ATP-binding protein [Nocardiopsaceae bacterium]|nr:ATP-binding protein [Nocardiopsaceae bacterium]
MIREARRWTPLQGTAGNPRASGPARRSEVLGSLTIPGRPEHVSSARAFITRTVSGLPGVDSDAATLLTSELVTNAIRHTRSGRGGTVGVTVIGLPDGILVEVTDQGAAGTPEVKDSGLYAAEGHGLYLVQQVAERWGYLRDPAGTTVWFHLPGAGPAPGQATRKVTPKATGNRTARAIAGVPGQRLRPAMSS